MPAYPHASVTFIFNEKMVLLTGFQYDLMTIRKWLTFFGNTMYLRPTGDAIIVCCCRFVTIATRRRDATARAINIVS